jgi:hypothetical protein
MVEARRTCLEQATLPQDISQDLFHVPSFNSPTAKGHPEYLSHKMVEYTDSYSTLWSLTQLKALPDPCGMKCLLISSVFDQTI